MANKQAEIKEEHHGSSHHEHHHHHGRTKADQHVIVDVDAQGKPTVDKDTVHVSKGKNDQVVWTNHASSTATITFSTSPFHKSSFTIHAGASVGSGPAAVSAGTKHYKYSITIGSKTLDPVVVVDN